MARVTDKLWDAAGDHDAPSEMEGDHPMMDLFMVLGPPFARRRSFWQAVLFACLIGLIVGIVALSFYYFTEKMSEELWFTESYKTKLGGIMKLGSGEWWYVGLGAGGGLVLSVARSLYGRFVVRLHVGLTGSLFTHVKDLEVHDLREALGILMQAAISLSVGCSLGPEAPLGVVGATLGYLSSLWMAPDESDDSDEQSSQTSLELEHRQFEKLLVRSGIAAAMGAVFCSPMISVVLVHELEQVIKDYRHAIVERQMKVTFMEGITHTAVAASIAWLVFDIMKTYTFMAEEKVPVAQDIVHFRTSFSIVAVLVGIAGGIIGAISFTVNLAMKALSMKLRAALNEMGRSRFRMTHGACLLGDFGMPILGGSLYGLIAVACPLTLGDGDKQLSALVQYGHTYGSCTLLVTAVAKIFSLSICNSFGFLGGPIFPMIFAGACVGRACADVFPDAFDDINLALLFVPCMSVAIATAYTPMVFTMTFCIAISMVVGAQWTTLIFTSAVSAYTTATGLGVVQSILLRAAQRAAPRDSHSDGED